MILGTTDLVGGVRIVRGDTVVLAPPALIFDAHSGGLSNSIA